MCGGFPSPTNHPKTTINVSIFPPPPATNVVFPFSPLSFELAFVLSFYWLCAGSFLTNKQVEFSGHFSINTGEKETVLSLVRIGCKGFWLL